MRAAERSAACVDIATAREGSAERGFIGGGGLLGARDEALGDDEEVHGSLRVDVVDDDAAVVLVLDLRGNFPVDDALKKGFRHDVRYMAGRRARFVAFFAGAREGGLPERA